MMEDATIPWQLTESEEYKALTEGQKFFLLELYISRGDCETFTIEKSNANGYGQDKTTIYRKIQALIESGLLLVNGIKYDGKIGPPERIYSFKHKVQ